MMIDGELPLISCICITSNRLKLLEKSISCFINQDYPNKQLIISYPVEDLETKTALNNYIHEDIKRYIKILERANDETIGYARNVAILKSNAEYICIWDDDDWYHPNRLSHQFMMMKNSPTKYDACILMHILLHDGLKKQSYVSFTYTWENTLMCRRAILLQNQYAHKNRGEDTHLVAFLEGKKMLLHIDDAPHLYIYIFHGRNIWNHTHFEDFTKKSQSLSESLNASILKLLI